MAAYTVNLTPSAAQLFFSRLIFSRLIFSVFSVSSVFQTFPSSSSHRLTVSVVKTFNGRGRRKKRRFTCAETPADYI